MKAAYRAKSLSLSQFAAAEKHGKRQDQTSQSRRVRDREPLVFGSLDLRAAYDAHVKDCRMNSALKKPVLHALIQFPIQLEITDENEEIMLEAAIAFVNLTHGGDAVFSARLDRDEAGRHTVDVFFSPKYEKITKSKGAETWISTTRHGKELALKHQDEIKRRSEDAKKSPKAITSPRAVGIAMQAELANFFEMAEVKLEPRREKASSAPDRVDPETFKARKDAESALAEAEVSRAKAERKLDEAHTSRDEIAALRAEAKAEAVALASALDERQKKIDADEIAISESQNRIADLDANLQERESRLEKSLANVERMRSAATRVLNDLARVVQQWTSTLGLTVPKEIKQLSDLEEAVDALKRDNIERIEEHNLENQDHGGASLDGPPLSK